jgi:membrane protein implicated in regulation of membrane protease activity
MFTVSVPFAAKAVVSLGIANVIAQSLPDVPMSGQITLVSALVVAVIFLWRALAEKDKQLLVLTEKVNTTTQAVLDAVKELRVSVDKLEK